MKYAMLAAMSLIMATTLWHPLATHTLSAPVPKMTAQDSMALGGDWYLQPVLASDTATGKLPVLRFNLKTGKFSGFTGCNQMNGSFRVQGDQLHFSEDIVLTKMACEGYNEKEFIVNLLRADRYQLKDGVLTLLVGQTPLSKWMRKPDTKRTA